MSLTLLFFRMSESSLRSPKRLLLLLGRFADLVAVQLVGGFPQIPGDGLLAEMIVGVGQNLRGLRAGFFQFFGDVLEALAEIGDPLGLFPLAVGEPGEVGLLLGLEIALAFAEGSLSDLGGPAVQGFLLADQIADFAGEVAVMPPFRQLGQHLAQRIEHGPLVVFRPIERGLFVVGLRRFGFGFVGPSSGASSGVRPCLVWAIFLALVSSCSMVGRWSSCKMPISVAMPTQPLLHVGIVDFVLLQFLEQIQVRAVMPSTGCDSRELICRCSISSRLSKSMSSNRSSPAFWNWILSCSTWSWVWICCLWAACPIHRRGGLAETRVRRSFLRARRWLACG